MSVLIHINRKLIIGSLHVFFIFTLSYDMIEVWKQKIPKYFFQAENADQKLILTEVSGWKQTEGWQPVYFVANSLGFKP